MKIIFISDTHEYHEKLKHLPKGDCICFCGDLMNSGHHQSSIINFLDWFKELKYKYKIFIAGNHDRYFENYPENIREIMKEYPDITYLEDSGIEIEGIHFWGSPWQPWFLNWAFNLRTNEELREKWDLIPENTDVLLTHGPMYGILDKTIDGKNVGCSELLKRVKQIKPKIHACGHIHEGYNLEYLDIDGHKTICVNASVLNENYILTNRPIKIEI